MPDLVVDGSLTDPPFERNGEENVQVIISVYACVCEAECGQTLSASKK